jgi:hypothetical protein
MIIVKEVEAAVQELDTVITRATLSAGQGKMYHVLKLPMNVRVKWTSKD